MVRVLIVDDSAAIRDLLKAVLGADPEITIAGLAADGEEAVRMTRELAPDVISMDLRMPRLDGIGAIKEIMHERPTPIVALYANAGGWQRHLGIEALKAGALEVVEKPRLETLGDIREFRKEFGTLLKLMAEVKVVRILRGLVPHTHHHGPLEPPSHAPVDAVGICASTGGPTALRGLLSDLPASFRPPVFVVQHIQDDFLPGLVEWLSSASSLPLEVAEHGADIVPGRVYFAPGGAHLTAGADGRMWLTSDPPVAGHRPAGNVLLRSLAEAYGDRALAVVLSGMGEDGAEGADAVSRAGGVVIAQDEATSIVYGMPRAVVERGAATEIVPLEDVAYRMAYWARADSSTLDTE